MSESWGDRMVSRDRRVLPFLRFALVLLALAWVATSWSRLDEPVLALVGLAAVAVFAPLPCRFTTTPRLRVLHPLVSGAASVTLVGLNGGAASALLPLWLAVLAGSCLSLPPLPWTYATTLAAGLAPALWPWDPRAATPVVLAATSIAIGCFLVSRRHAESVARLRSYVVRDPLTGLPNRGAIDERLEQLLRVREPGRPLPSFSLLWIDLDGFRHVNNDRGHAAGDRALVEAARRLRDAAPEGFVARNSGDEFVVLLPTCNGALQRAETLIERISQSPIEEVVIGASIGVAYAPVHGVTPDALRDAADQALRWAKQAGKSRAIEFDASRAGKDDGTPGRIRRLWEDDRIDVVVQPIVCLQSGRIRSYEALARLRVDGDPSPLRWFARAERHGLRPELEVACLERALRLLPNRPVGTRLSVNLSPELLAHPEVRRLFAAVSDPEAVVLELTENAVIDDYQLLRELLEPLQQRGMTLAVDDFGAGQANMRHVEALAPRYLKLDRSLVTDIDQDERREAMVEALVQYAWRTGSYLIAEGVETSAELERLRALGVHFAQGYLLAAPQPPWPAIETHALTIVTAGRSSVRQLNGLVVEPDTMNAAAAQELFMGDPALSAIVLVDDARRIRALLSRNRLLFNMSARFGYSLYAERPAIQLADTAPLIVRHETPRAEIVSRAMARSADYRFDPIIVSDDLFRPIAAITIEELLEERQSALPADDATYGVSRLLA